MDGGLKSRWGMAAIVAAASILTWGTTSARAADLGGDCCADLEERVAELEATTARKGNRKVSLTVSGWVSQAVFFWDDGTESNVYVGTNSLEQDRFRFTGEAKIDTDWSAGYTLEIGLYGADSKQFSQNEDTGTNANTLVTRKAFWYVKSKTYGKLEVGLDGTATYHLLDDADFTQTRNVSDAEAPAVGLGAFLIRENGAFVNGLKWTDVLRGVNNSTPGQNGRRNIVRYDSPDFHGFVLTASWGEDDMWGTALTYKGDIGDFKLVAKVGYEQNLDEVPTNQACSVIADQDCEWYGAAATIQHTPTGLYLYGGYGHQQDDAEDRVNALADPTDTTWFVQPGIEKKWFDLGKTTIYGEYRHDDTGSNLGKVTTAGDNSTFIQSGDIDFWGGGFIQGIEKADMILYIYYRRAEGDFVNAAGTKFDLDDFDLVVTGGKINF